MSPLTHLTPVTCSPLSCFVTHFICLLISLFCRFRCTGCGRSWPSKKVMVVFHFSRNAAKGCGSVKVRSCKQECRRCNAPRKEKPTFTRENIDVMVEKLIEKIKFRCYGENVGESSRFSRFSGDVNGPHESSHCEACQLGICQQGTWSTQLPLLGSSEQTLTLAPPQITPPTTPRRCAYDGFISGLWNVYLITDLL